MPHWELIIGHEGGPGRTVAIDADCSTTVAELAAATGLDAASCYRNDELLSPSATLATIGLRHGQRISARPEARYRRTHDTGLMIVAVTGPDAGRSIGLGPVPVVIGRSPSADLLLSDLQVSGRHLRVTAAEGAQGLIEDLGSTNGTRYEGRPIEGSMIVDTGDQFLIGETVLTLIETAAEPPDHVAVPGSATAAVPRAFRPAIEPIPTDLRAPHPPPDSSEGSTTWWRSLTPLATGVGFAAMTGRWQFLLIIAFAPLVFAIDALRSRRHRAATRAQNLADHEQALASHRHLVRHLRHRAVVQRRADQRCAGTVVAAPVSTRLWERRLTDADFGSVTLGFAALPTPVTSDQDEALVGSPSVWGTPLTLDLASSGSLAVIGPQARRRAVVRGLVLHLTTTHSPDELQLWVLADPTNLVDWDFTRWLPHTRSGSGTVAARPEDRAQLLADLRSIVDQRQSLRPPPIGQTPTGQSTGDRPLIVMVVDGTELNDPEELGRLLDDGLEVGVVGIVGDRRHGPTGVNARLTIGANGFAEYSSSHQAHLVDLRIAEPAPELADRAARDLAGVRPAGRPSAHEDVLHLLDLRDELGLVSTDSASIAQRWAEHPPTTRALIGLTAGAPFHIDLAEHGPHGLIGGMSGSGKTEFLLTLLSSLCLENHPDDLAIALIDFKGGVDHQLSARLPHVISLSTNLGLGGFTRAVTLLDAEQQRRQALLQGIGGDLETYREARRHDPSLPALPRLLIVVDEFSELLASDEGRERLAEVVRITRIGRALGVHLLLVTQNFEGQLPPQIDANAGLRVCLRVMKPTHSRVVLDAPAASDIAEHDVGRGFARLAGGDLVGFRTARVAGSRNLHDVRTSALTVTPLAYGPCPPTAHRSNRSKVPLEASDMARLTETLWAAARTSGWTASAVPWPDELPTTLELADTLAFADTLAAAGASGVTLGLCDRPELQRHEPLRVSNDDDQILLLGGPDAALGDVLVAWGTAAALGRDSNDLHLYGIDLDGSGLHRLAGFPHAGDTIATRDEAHARRILGHLVTEVARRRARTHTGRNHRILLLVSGVDRLLRRSEGRADEGRAKLLGLLGDLVTDAIGVGVQIVLTGGPTLADSRLAGNVTRRFVFRLGGETSPAGYGVPRSLVDQLSGATRAVETGCGHLVQFAVPTADPDRSAGLLHSLGVLLGEQYGTLRNPPPVFPTVTWPLPLEAMELEKPPSGLAHPLPVGVDTETGTVRWIDLAEDGPFVAVAGASGSGRTTTIRTLARLARRQGFATVATGGSRRSLRNDLGELDRGSFDQLAEPGEFVAALAEAATSGPAIGFVDDLHRLTSDDLDLARLTRTRAVALVASAPPDFLSGRSDLRRRLPVSLAGLLLAPTGVMDGQAVGLAGRLDDEVRTNRRPGRGIVASAGEWHPVQVPQAASDELTADAVMIASTVGHNASRARAASSPSSRLAATEPSTMSTATANRER